MFDGCSANCSQAMKNYSLTQHIYCLTHSWSGDSFNCLDLCFVVQTRIASMTASRIIKLCDFPLEWVLYFSRPIFEIVESHFCCFYMGAHQIIPSEKINVLMIYLLKKGTCDPSARNELEMGAQKDTKPPQIVTAQWCHCVGINTRSWCNFNTGRQRHDDFNTSPGEKNAGARI